MVSAEEIINLEDYSNLVIFFFFKIYEKRLFISNFISNKKIKSLNLMRISLFNDILLYFAGEKVYVNINN